MPEAMYFAISALAGSWKRSGIGRGADTRYGTLLSFKYILIRCAHIGRLSSVSENTFGNAANVFVFKLEKQRATAATAGKEAGMT